MVGSGGRGAWGAKAGGAGGPALKGRRDTRYDDAEVEAVLAPGKAAEAGGGGLGRFGAGERRLEAEGARERWSMLVGAAGGVQRGNANCSKKMPPR